MFADDLSPGNTICLPGSELPGCRNVLPFNGSWDCKYYVMQLGDSISSVAFSLNIYQPDLELANFGLDAQKLKEGDLIVMPPWDAEKCGILPPTLEQLNSGIVVQPPTEAPQGSTSPTPQSGNGENSNSPSPRAQPSSSPSAGGDGSGQESPNTIDPVPRAPPSTDQPASPNGGGDTSSPSPSPSPDSSPAVNDGGAPTTITSPGTSPDAATTTAMPEKCRGFRARETDDLYSIAALFSVEVTLLVSVNPDLGAGFPIVPGAMIKIPPYNATCSFPTLVDASQIPYSPSTPLDGFDVDAVQPGNFSSGAIPGGTKPSNGPAPAPVSYVDIGAGDYYGSGGGDSSGDPGGGGGGDVTTISEDDTIIQNIVADGGNSNAPLPKQSAVNPASIMLGSFVFVGALAVFAMLGLAFSGTAPMPLSMKKFKIIRDAENAPNNV